MWTWGLSNTLSCSSYQREGVRTGFVQDVRGLQRFDLPFFWLWNRTRFFTESGLYVHITSGEILNLRHFSSSFLYTNTTSIHLFMVEWSWDEGWRVFLQEKVLQVILMASVPFRYVRATSYNWCGVNRDGDEGLLNIYLHIESHKLIPCGVFFEANNLFPWWVPGVHHTLCKTAVVILSPTWFFLIWLFTTQFTELFLLCRKVDYMWMT